MSDKPAILIGRLYEKLQTVLESEVWESVDNKHKFDNWKIKVERDMYQYHMDLRFTLERLEEMSGMIWELICEEDS